MSAINRKNSLQNQIVREILREHRTRKGMVGHKGGMEKISYEKKTTKYTAY